MSYQCLRCYKNLSSLKRLQTHQEKQVPCDFQCKRCDFKGTNSAEYKTHQNVHLKKISNRKTRIKLPEKRGVKTPLIPYEDFNQCLVFLADLANKKDVEIELTIKPSKRQTEALKTFQASDYANSLQCINQDINFVATNFLTNFHCDPNRPQLHTFKIGDLTRKTVNIYSRPKEEEEAKWILLPKEPAINTITAHTSKILTYALELAANMLQYKWCVQEETVCFSLHDPILNKTAIIIDQNTFDDTGFVTGPPILRSLFYNSKLTDIEPDDHLKTEQVRALGALINEKIDEVISQLENLVLADTDIVSFLHRTRCPSFRG
jgi:DNA-directed RNA polymerase subunit RPC12/RpoP